MRGLQLSVGQAKRVSSATCLERQRPGCWEMHQLPTPTRAIGTCQKVTEAQANRTCKGLLCRGCRHHLGGTYGGSHLRRVARIERGH